MCTLCFLLILWLKSIQIKSQKEGYNHISDLQDDKTGLEREANSLLDQNLTGYDIMLSTSSQNDTSVNGKSKNLALNIIDKKNEDDFPRDIDGHKLSPYELHYVKNLT